MDSITEHAAQVAAMLPGGCHSSYIAVTSISAWFTPVHAIPMPSLHCLCIQSCMCRRHCTSRQILDTLSCLLQAFLPWACTCMALRPHLPVPQVSCARHWKAWWQPPAYTQKSCCSFHPKAGSSCASTVLLALPALPPFQSVSSSWRQACLASAS